MGRGLFGLPQKSLSRGEYGWAQKWHFMVTDERRRELNLDYFREEVGREWETYHSPVPNRQQRVRRQRLKLAVDSVCHLVPSGGSVLDVGCGVGSAAISLSQAGYQVTAVDMVEEMLERGRQSCSQVNWVHSTFGDHVAPRKSFDAILCLGYLEYQERAGKELVRMGRLLKPGGVLLLSVPNTLSGQFALGLTRAYYRLASEPETIPVRHSYTPERLQRHLGMAGYILMDYQWLGGQSFRDVPLSLERPRDFWQHRLRDRFAPEMMTLSRTYRPADTLPETDSQPDG